MGLPAFAIDSTPGPECLRGPTPRMFIGVLLTPACRLCRLQWCPHGYCRFRCLCHRNQLERARSGAVSVGCLSWLCHCRRSATAASATAINSKEL